MPPAGQLEPVHGGRQWQCQGRVALRVRPRGGAAVQGVLCCCVPHRHAAVHASFQAQEAKGEATSCASGKAKLEGSLKQAAEASRAGGAGPGLNSWYSRGRTCVKCGCTAMHGPAAAAACARMHHAHWRAHPARAPPPRPAGRGRQAAQGGGLAGSPEGRPRKSSGGAGAGEEPGWVAGGCAAAWCPVRCWLLADRVC